MYVGPNKANPYGLSVKQELVIEDAKETLKRTGKFDLITSHQKFYNVKSRQNAASVSTANAKKENFREAMIASLTEKGILGANGEVEHVLKAGLKAEDKDGNVNHETRLKYAQELNKIAGVYAPERRATLNLNLDMPEDELNKHISELQDQL